MKKIHLHYGRDGLPLRLPEALKVTEIHKKAMPILPASDAQIAAALDVPIGAPPLRQYAQGRKNACILICDNTRPVPNGILLPPIMDRLRQAGIRDEDIRIVIATGLHRPNKGKEREDVVGNAAILKHIRVENHYARDRDAHEDLGVTSGGIPIIIDKRFVAADVRIVVGLVEPHFMAGYSGGRKLVAPGVAYKDTILNFHSAHILEHPKAANCVLDGNPLHEQQMEIVQRVGDIFAVNVVLDEQRRVGFVSAGDIERSHLAAVEFTRRYAEVVVPRQFHTVVSTAAGYPLDNTYYQTIKGMVSALGILAPNGTIIVAGACEEGMGSPEFVEAQALLCRKGPQSFIEELKGRTRALIDEWQTEMLVKALKVGKVQLYTTGLNEADLQRVFVEPVSSLEQAIQTSVDFYNDPHVAVIPEGPYVIPVHRNG